MLSSVYATGQYILLLIVASGWVFCLNLSSALCLNVEEIGRGLI
jgi:hypothetical protein